MAQPQPRERPGVYRTFPQPFTLRLSEEQKQRAEAAAKRMSKSVSDFMRDAVMARVGEVEEEVERKKQAKKEAIDHAFVPRSPRSPQVFKAVAPPPVPEPPTPLPVPQIVVQVPAQVPVAQSGKDDLDIAVEYLRTARNTVDRQERERILQRMIEAAYPATEDRKRVAKMLDEKAKAASPGAATSSPRSIWSFLR